MVHAVGVGPMVCSVSFDYAHGMLVKWRNSGMSDDGGGHDRFLMSHFEWECWQDMAVSVCTHGLV
jgi:hypothetical protein